MTGAYELTQPNFVVEGVISAQKVYKNSKIWVCDGGGGNRTVVKWRCVDGNSSIVQAVIMSYPFFNWTL